MPQAYNERLLLRNISDSTNNQIVHIKANVFQSRTFFLKSLDLDFGTCLIDEESTQYVQIQNVSVKPRSFTISIDKFGFRYCNAKITFILENDKKDQNQPTISSVNSLTFTLEPEKFQKIKVILRPQLIPKEEIDEEIEQEALYEENKGTLLVYETKNSEINKKINYSATIYYDKTAYEVNFFPKESQRKNLLFLKNKIRNFNFQKHQKHQLNKKKNLKNPN